MKDIKIKTPFIKIQYSISWIFFIVAGFPLIWLIALGLYIYGKDTLDNKEKKKDILNMTYQKFIFVYGSIVGGIAIFLLLLALIFALVDGVLSFSF